MMENKIVEIRKIVKEKWHGLKGDQDISRPIIIVPIQIGMRYQTGLTKEEIEKLETITGFDLSDRYNLDKPHLFGMDKFLV